MIRFVLLLTTLLVGMSAVAQEWRFTNVTVEAGMSFPTNEALAFASVAAADYDRDGWVDLLITKNGGGPNLLYRNLGNGTFENVAIQAGLAGFAQVVNSALFFDFDGDGWLDVFFAVRNIEQQRIYLNMGNGTFQEVLGTGISMPGRVFSPTAGDYNGDGYLDLYVAMNRDPGTPGLNQLWRNNGNGTFSDVGETAGILAFQDLDVEFTPNFADINNDGWADLLVVADFNTSQVYLNKKDGTFENITDRTVITDEGGMGSAIGDYDNDGDLDWFVSSILDPDDTPNTFWTGFSGNRFYRNRGDGTFEDVTDETGTRVGWWGWGSMFADFNNDGWLDLFHTNGNGVAEQPFFSNDPVRMFVSNRDGSFTENSDALNLKDIGVGNGVACFDYDHDGDLDIFIANATLGSKLYRNDGGNAGNSLSIRLEGDKPNVYGVGGRVYLTAGGITQMREMSAANHYLSHNPYIAFFGMSSETSGDLVVKWPDGTWNQHNAVAANQQLTLYKLHANFKDTSQSFYSYMKLVDGDLARLRNSKKISDLQAKDMRESALTAFIREKYK